MFKFHVTLDGKIERCFAFLRACPRKQHFTSMSDANQYMKQWEHFKMTYQAIQDEPILEPGSHFMVPAKEWKQTDILAGIPVNQNSMVCLIGEDSREGMRTFLRSRIMEKDFPKLALAHAGDYAFQRGMKKIYKTATASLAGLDRRMNIMEKRFHDEEFYKPPLQMVHDLCDQLSELEIAKAFQYQTADIFIDQNTKIRVFYHDPDQFPTLEQPKLVQEFLDQNDRNIDIKRQQNSIGGTQWKKR